eukprot:2472284-Amphidinium_carterae.1
MVPRVPRDPILGDHSLGRGCPQTLVAECSLARRPDYSTCPAIFWILLFDGLECTRLLSEPPPNGLNTDVNPG